MAKASLLIPIVKQYFQKDPSEAAIYLQSLEKDQATDILTSISPAQAAKIFPFLPNEIAASWLQAIPPEFFGEIFKKLSSQQGASLLMSLSAEAQQKMIAALPEKLKDEISELLSFPNGSVGQIMTTQYMAFRRETLVKQAVEKIRISAKKNAPPSYLYVVDDLHKLIGILTVRDLLLADRNATVESIMRKEVFTIDGFMDQQDAVKIFSEKKYFAVPVIDAEGRLLGLVKADQLLLPAQEETSQDIQTMFGVGKSETPFSPVRFSLKTRLPWLHINLLTAFMAASVVAIFESIIAKITVLAIFLPVVAGQGGNAGAQSLAVVMRGLVMRQIPKERVKGLIFKESYLGLLNGVIIGLVTGVIAWVWKGNPYLGMVITLAMIVNLFAAGMAGALIPITMKAVGLDPAQSSSIILTTVTDVVGFFAFLSFAVMFQGFLVG